MTTHEPLHHDVAQLPHRHPAVAAVPEGQAARVGSRRHRLHAGREGLGRAPDEMRMTVARLATTFMAGEEAVTLDIVPLIRAVSDEGRAEETLFLTTFLGDEAKHAEFFRTLVRRGRLDRAARRPAHRRAAQDLRRRAARRDGTARHRPLSRGVPQRGAHLQPLRRGRPRDDRLLGVEPDLRRRRTCSPG